MSDTKERIMEVALKLFAESGYLGTSMSDIAKQLGITKAALYKHYTGKQEILNRIIQRMNQTDSERAKKFEMPEGNPNEVAKAYLHTSADKIRAYSKAQFWHWTEEEFPSEFRKMLTLEQYRDPKMAELYEDYLAAGPLNYMTAIFRETADCDEEANQMALDFYGPMFLLYSVYDNAADKKQVIAMLDGHIDRFIAQMESKSKKK